MRLAACPIGVEHRRLPIPDHGLPHSAEHMAEILAAIDGALAHRRASTCIAAPASAAPARWSAATWSPTAAGRRGARRAQPLWRSAPRLAWRARARDRGTARFRAATGRCSRRARGRGRRAAAGGRRDRRGGCASASAARCSGSRIGDALAAADPDAARAAASRRWATCSAAGNFELPRGAWTDDTAMALCLAESLLESAASMPRDQVARYHPLAARGTSVRHRPVHRHHGQRRRGRWRRRSGGEPRSPAPTIRRSSSRSL